MSLHSHGPILRAALASALLLLAARGVMAGAVEFHGAPGEPSITPMPGIAAPTGPAGTVLTPAPSGGLTPGIAPPAPAPTPMPPLEPAPAAGTATTAPIPVKARRIIFTCDLAPQAETCHRKAEPPDGGDSGSECNCTHDLCLDYTDPANGLEHRICEKLQ
jgi:hypothetical protein